MKLTAGVNLALDRQMEIIAWLGDEIASQPYMAWFVASLDALWDEYADPTISSMDKSERVKAVQDGLSQREVTGWRHQIHDLLLSAPPYWVSDEMVAMINQAADRIPKNTVEAIDLPTASGFIALEMPMSQPSIMPLRALSWAEVPIRHKNKQGDWEDKRGVQLLGFTGRDDPMPIDDKGDSVSMSVVYETRLPAYALVDSQGWSYGVEWNEVPYEERPEGIDAFHATPNVAHWRRWMLTFWRLCQQEVPAVTQANRSTRRRWLKTAAKPPEWGSIRIVTLRKYKQKGGKIIEPDELFTRDWSHRWPVRGHWRKQYYPSEDVHRPVWISPYIKGPPDKPLIIRKDVYGVVR